jgi:hypothetical protein
LGKNCFETGAAGRINKIKLRLVATKQFSNGEMAMNYIVDR